MSQLHPVTRAAATPDVAQFFDALEESFDKVPNLFAVMAHFPASMQPMLGLFQSLYNQTALEPRLAELVVIQVSYTHQSHYCLTLHKTFALERGVTMEEIRALQEPRRLDIFSEKERVVLAFADQYARDAREISDALREQLRAHYSDAEVVNLTLLMGLASLFGQTANALQIPIDTQIGAGADFS